MPRASYPVPASCTKATVRWTPTWESTTRSRTHSMLMVANRLPVHRVRSSGDDHWATSPGGLVSALKSVLADSQLGDDPVCWVGWAGDTGVAPRPFEHDGILYDPIPLSDEELENYYGGFANATLWPLYHDAVRPPVYHRTWWYSYVEVNRRFAREVADRLAPGGTAWIHDYHLQLVPRFLREMRPDARISFFLHIPFPPEELFAQIPWRRELLEGMLGADVVGFQTRLGAQNFSRLARRFTAAGGSDEMLKLGDRLTKVAAFPISVDFKLLNELSRKPEVIARAEELERSLGGRKLFLGVDRLDYTKGIDTRLRAYETFLLRNPGAAGDVVFVQIAVPSREEVDDYVAIRTRVEQLVGQINGAFSQPGHTPVIYLYRSLDLEELIAYYRAADVMVVTPVRDGMNLVAKEYVATRPANDGVLILSEFTGAAKELEQALLVNPHDIDGLAASFSAALEMSEAERSDRMQSMRERLTVHDVHRWAKQCLELP